VVSRFSVRTTDKNLTPINPNYEVKNKSIKRGRTTLTLDSNTFSNCTTVVSVPEGVDLNMRNNQYLNVTTPVEIRKKETN